MNVEVERIKKFVVVNREFISHSRTLNGIRIKVIDEIDNRNTFGQAGGFLLNHDDLEQIFFHF